MAEKEVYQINENILESTRCDFDTTGTIWTDRQFSHPERTIRIATGFSGISAPDFALKRLGLKSKIVFACDIGERYLNYNFKRLREFAMELKKTNRKRFAKHLYLKNRAKVNSINESRRKKGLKEIPFSRKLVYDCLFNGGNTIEGQLELVKQCLDIILKDKGINKRAEIEKYVSDLYDEKGRNYVKDAFFANYDIKEEDWHTDIRFMDATPYKGQVDLYVGGSPCVSYSRAGRRLTLDDTRGQLFYDFAVRIKECEPKVFIFENVADMMRANNEGEKSGLQAALEVFESLGYKLYWNILEARNYGVPQHRERVWVIGFKDNVDFKFPSSIPLNLCMYDLLDTDILPRSGEVPEIDERELTYSEYLRFMGFRDFKVPDSIQELGDNKVLEKMRFMAGNSMVVECLMALYLQMDITKYGIDEIGDLKLKSSLYEYTDDELDDLINKAVSLKGRVKSTGKVDFSYLQKGLLPNPSRDILKVGAKQSPPKKGKGDSQGYRYHSVRGACPTLTKCGKVNIIVANVNTSAPKTLWKEPVKRIPTLLW